MLNDKPEKNTIYVMCMPTDSVSMELFQAVDCISNCSSRRWWWWWWCWWWYWRCVQMFRMKPIWCECKQTTHWVGCSDASRSLAANSRMCHGARADSDSRQRLSVRMRCWAHRRCSWMPASSLIARCATWASPVREYRRILWLVYANSSWALEFCATPIGCSSGESPYPSRIGCMIARTSLFCWPSRSARSFPDVA